MVVGMESNSSAGEGEGEAEEEVMDEEGAALGAIIGAGGGMVLALPMRVDGVGGSERGSLCVCLAAT